MTTSTKKWLLGALVVPAIALAAACTSGGNEDKAAPASVDAASGGSATAPEAAPADAPDALDGLSTDFSTKDLDSSRSASLAESAPGTSANGQSAGTGAETGAETGAGSAPSARAPQTAAVISKGQVSLRSKDIDKTRFELQKVLDALDGTIADEQSTANKAGKTIRQRLVLRVPSRNFGDAMDQISVLKPGTLIGRNRSSQDVTTEVIDNRTRVATQRASLARIQALLAEADSLRDVISIEAQLSRRQADLDSLEAQQKYLADQTSLATINVYLTAPAKKKASAGGDDDHNFFSGLESGWDHLGSSTNAVLTGIGAVLPFAVLLALLGAPVWVAWRRRSARPAADPVPSA